MRKLVLIGLMGFYFQSFAQQSEPVAETKDWVIRFGGLVPSLELKAQQSGASSEPLEYKPSNQSKTFVGITHDHYGLALSAFSPRTSEQRTQYGNGHSIDVQFRYSIEDFYLESFYQQYKGYYLSNSKSVMSSPMGSDGEYPYNGSLKTEHYGFMLMKILDTKSFHPKRAFEFTERPTQSGGSWYYSASLNIHGFKTSDSLIPTTAFDSYPDLQDLRHSKAYTLAIGGGGAYSYVFSRSWVLSGLFGLSLGNQWIESKYVSRRSSNNVGSVKNQLKLALGYSGEKFLSGMTFQSDGTQIKNHGTELNFSTLEVALFMGTRF